LEKKAELLGQIQKDETEKKGTLKTKRDVLEQNVTQRIEGLEKAAKPIEQIQRDEIKKTVALDTTVEFPEHVRRNDIKKSGALEKMAELLQRDVTKKSEGLEKAAERIGQGKEDWIIIPTALVDSPILEGVSMEKLSGGVCHIAKSAAPGQGGNCIIEGHNLGEFGWWRTQGPFNMLEIMEKGIHIYIFHKGKKYIYKVKEKIYTDVNDPKLYDFSPGERLTLITCTSTLDITVYTNKRTVIVAYPE